MVEGLKRPSRADFEKRFAPYLSYYRDFYSPATDPDTPESQLKMKRAKRIVEDIEQSNPQLHNILQRLAMPVDRRLTLLIDLEAAERQKRLTQVFKNISLYTSFVEGLALDVMWTAVAKDNLEESQMKEGYNHKGEWVVRDTIPEPNPVWVEAAAGPTEVDAEEVKRLEDEKASLLASLPERQRNKYLKKPNKYHWRYDPFK